VLEVDKTGRKVRSLELPGVKASKVYPLPSEQLLVVLTQDEQVKLASLSFKALAKRNPLAKVGEECSYNRDCTSHSCTYDKDYRGTCADAGLDMGAMCKDDANCASHLCVEQACVAAGLAAGTACVDHRQCQSGLCQTQCVEHVLEVGAHCTQPVQCISNVCEGEMCGLAP
jgi:hypothetical protein